MTTGLLVGRFQPFHKGHLEVVKELLKECDELIIGIGSAQYSHTEENPFTAAERFAMIRASLDDEKIPRSKYTIVPITDIHNNAMWVNYVCNICPKFDVLFTRNPLVTRLVKEAGIAVEEQPEFDRHIYSGTKIRKAMLEDKPWEKFVPGGAVRVIKQFGGVERLQSVVGND